MFQIEILENQADLAFLAPTLHANNLLEIGVDSEYNSFLILPNGEADAKFARIMYYLKTNHILDIHLRTISEENSNQYTN
jgi:hypothetical protein